MGAAGPVAQSAAVSGSEPVAAGSLTVTLVLTDVAGSTRLWAEHPDAMSAVMARHHEIVHAAITAHGGWRPVDQGEGDAVFAAVDSPTAAVAAVVRFQRELTAEPWPAGIDIKVRVGVHTGEVTARDGNLFGSTVNRCARLRGLGSGGQVLLSAPTWELVRDRLPDGVTVTDLGEHRMKDLTRAEHIHQLEIDGLPAEFPPLASLDRARHNLPIQTSSFLGRDREVDDLVDLVTRERLVTIVGFGGMGKTRLALQVAAELAVGDGDGVWFIDLSAVTDTGQLPSLVAATLEIAETAAGPLPSLVAGLKDKRLLLVLDNLEQLLPDAASPVDQIVRAGSGIRVLVTSREPLQLRGEHSYVLSPLPVPPVAPRSGGWTDAELGSLSTYAAVALFIARAAAARQGFTLTASNAAAIAAICQRLDGLPLALELAAARTRLLSPEALLPRLENALKMLTGGSRDLPARHQTLRATIAWSYDALDPEQQKLLDRLSIFPGSFTLDAAEAVCGPALTEGEDDLDVLEGLSVLVDRSLVQTHPAADGQAEDRYDLLVSIRDYAAEHLHASELTLAMAGRHAAYYTAATTYPADSTWDDIDRIDQLRHDELHHLRAALSYAHTHGTPAEEQLLAAHATAALNDEGRQTEADIVAARALDRSPSASIGRILLLAGRVGRASHTFRWNEARPDAVEALAEARQVGDRALMVAAFSTVLPSARTPAEYQGWVAEAAELLAGPPTTYPGLPWWWVRYRWDGALGMSPLTPAADAEAALRRQLAAEPEIKSASVLSNLGSIFWSQGRWEEGLEFFQPYEDSGGPPHASPMDRIIGAANASEVRLALAHVEQAAQDIDLLDRLVHEHDVPDWAADLQLRRAALDRLNSRPAEGLRRLRTVIEDATSGAADHAYAYFLLAVLHRETGALVGAAQHLGEAWRSASEQGAAALALTIPLLLERATQLAEINPAEAVRLIGLVRARRPVDRVADFGVVYNLTAMLDALRDRLGAEVVDAILADAATQPLPDQPDWSTSPEAHRAHAAGVGVPASG